MDWEYWNQVRRQPTNSLLQPRAVVFKETLRLGRGIKYVSLLYRKGGGVDCGYWIFKTNTARQPPSKTILQNLLIDRTRPYPVIIIHRVIWATHLCCCAFAPLLVNVRISSWSGASMNRERTASWSLLLSSHRMERIGACTRWMAAQSLYQLWSSSCGRTKASQRMIVGYAAAGSVACGWMDGRMDGWTEIDPLRTDGWTVVQVLRPSVCLGQ